MTTPHTRYWQDLLPGERFSTGNITISRQDILEFAADFDHQPYNLNPEVALLLTLFLPFSTLSMKPPRSRW